MEVKLTPEIRLVDSSSSQGRSELWVKIYTQLARRQTDATPTTAIILHNDSPTPSCIMFPTNPTRRLTSAQAVSLMMIWAVQWVVIKFHFLEAIRHKERRYSVPTSWTKRDEEICGSSPSNSLTSAAQTTC